MDVRHPTTHRLGGPEPVREVAAGGRRLGIPDRHHLSQLQAVTCHFALDDRLGRLATTRPTFRDCTRCGLGFDHPCSAYTLLRTPTK